jgi:AcrR family transcriptional regulator
MNVTDAPAPTRETLTREAVIAATRELIVQESLDAVSLRRVGAALGVTAPALYAYVTDKRDLMRGVAEFEFDQLIARFASITDPDPVVRIRQSSRAYIDYALERPELFKTMFLFPPDLSVTATTGDELPNATRAFELSLAAVSEAIERGVFRAVDPVMAGLTLWTATHGCANVLLLGFALDDNSRESLITSVIETVIAGLSA